jgi:shikimate dehydrogenase
MKLGIIGNPVKHSLSPQLYREILGEQLETYELLNYENSYQIPSLIELSKTYDGLNITSPYKQHFVSDLTIACPVVKSLNAVNTIAFTTEGIFGTNTDLLAVDAILNRYRSKYPSLHIILLGNGTMAKVTTLVTSRLSIKITHICRSIGRDISLLNLLNYRETASQNIVINACSRDFVFKGVISKEDIFWDYNYSFLPHQNTLPGQVKTYEDGQELLRLQALAAANFWIQTNPKLKC